MTTQIVPYVASALILLVLSPLVALNFGSAKTPQEKLPSDANIIFRGSKIGILWSRYLVKERRVQYNVTGGSAAVSILKRECLDDEKFNPNEVWLVICKGTYSQDDTIMLQKLLGIIEKDDRIKLKIAIKTIDTYEEGYEWLPEAKYEHPAFLVAVNGKKRKLISTGPIHETQKLLNFVRYCEQFRAQTPIEGSK